MPLRREASFLRQKRRYRFTGAIQAWFSRALPVFSGGKTAGFFVWKYRFRLADLPVEEMVFYTKD